MCDFLDASKSYCNSAVNKSKKTKFISKQDKRNVIYTKIDVKTFFFHA
jgi:hypothetical protein